MKIIFIIALIIVATVSQAETIECNLSHENGYVCHGLGDDDDE